MATTGSALVLYHPRTRIPKRPRWSGSWGGHKGRTREAYELDLRQFARWCQHRGQRLFDVTRVDIEPFARDLEQSGRAPATISRRLATITGLYRFAEEEGLIDHSPAVHVRRPGEPLKAPDMPIGRSGTLVPSALADRRRLLRRCHFPRQAPVASPQHPSNRPRPRSRPASRMRGSATPLSGCCGGRGGDGGPGRLRHQRPSLRDPIQVDGEHPP